MFIKNIRLIVSLLLTLAFSTSTFASENYSGTDCKHEFGANELNFTWNGDVFNNADTTTWVVCHIPHTDFDGTFHTGAIESGFVHVIDHNSVSNISCRFRAPRTEANGAVIVDSTASASSAGFGTQRRQLNLGNLQETWNSSYVMSCTIPGRDSGTGRASSIKMYRVNQ